MYLLHLQVLHRPHMGHEQELAGRSELAQRAPVAPPVLRDVTLTLSEVGKQNGGDLVPLIGYVKLELVQAVGIVVTSIAS